MEIYLQLKNWRVYGFCSVAFEAADDGVEDLLSDGHLFGVVVPGSLMGKDDSGSLTLFFGKISLPLNA